MEKNNKDKNEEGGVSDAKGGGRESLGTSEPKTSNTIECMEVLSSLYLRRYCRSAASWRKGVQNLVARQAPRGLMLRGRGGTRGRCRRVRRVGRGEWKKLHRPLRNRVWVARGQGAGASELLPGQTRSYKELFPDGLGGEGLGWIHDVYIKGTRCCVGVGWKRVELGGTGVGSSKILGPEITVPPFLILSPSLTLSRTLHSPSLSRSLALPLSLSHTPPSFHRRFPTQPLAFVVPPSLPLLFHKPLLSAGATATTNTTTALPSLLTTYPKSNLAFTRQRNFITAPTLEVRTKSPANLII